MQFIGLTQLKKGQKISAKEGYQRLKKKLPTLKQIFLSFTIN
jgi:hypothetical protein